MNPIPSGQICATHQTLIAAMVDALNGSDDEQAQRLIAQYREDGWMNLASQLENWLHGAEPATAALDDEDRQIVQGIRQAQTDPDWLSRLIERARTDAAEGIARLIVAATWGDPAALELLSNLREAATEDGIEGSLAHAFVAMVEGERDIEALVERYPKAESTLLCAIVHQVRVQETE